MEKIIETRQKDNIEHSDENVALIFIDNIERTESKAYEIITSIYELTRIQRMYFVFVANKDIFFKSANANKNLNNIEYIEKFITTPKFKLVSSIEGMLLSKLKNNNKFMFFYQNFLYFNKTKEVIAKFFPNNRILTKTNNYDKWINFFDNNDFVFLNNDQNGLLENSVICFYAFRTLFEITDEFDESFNSLISSVLPSVTLNDYHKKEKLDVYYKKLEFLIEKIDLNLITKVQDNILVALSNLLNYLRSQNYLRELHLTNIIRNFYSFKKHIENQFNISNTTETIDWEQLCELIEKREFLNTHNLSKKFINWFINEFEKNAIGIIKILYSHNKIIFDFVRTLENENKIKQELNGYFSFFNETDMENLKIKINDYFNK